MEKVRDFGLKHKIKELSKEYASLKKGKSNFYKDKLEELLNLIQQETLESCMERHGEDIHYNLTRKEYQTLRKLCFKIQDEL